MKKVLALVLAVIMVCTMAFAVTITGNKTIVAGSSSDEFAGVTVTALTPGESIIFTVKDLFDTNYYTVDSNTVTGGKKFVPANNKVTVNFYAGKSLITEGWQMIDPDGEEVADNYQYVITVKEDLTKALDSKVDLIIKSISVKATGKNAVDVAKAVSGKNYTTLTVDSTETPMVFDVGYAKDELTINGSNGTVALEEVALNTIYTIKAGKDSKDKDVTTGKWTDGTRTLTVTANGTLIKKDLAYVGTYVEGTVLKDVKAEKIMFNSRNQYSVTMTSFVENAKASYNAYAIKGDGSVTKLAATLDDGVLTFTMPAFSYVVVVDGTLATTATEPATPGTTNPGTGANDVVGVAAALAVVALVSGAAISLKK